MNDMGSWGMGPFDNDDAADMVAGLSRHIGKANGKRRPDNHYLAARAATRVLLMTAGTDILGGPSLDEALACLRRMRDDEAWIGGWKSPRALCRILDREIADVTGAIHRLNSRSRRIMKRLGKARRRGNLKPQWSGR